jgi:hypothetical protein
MTLHDTQLIAEARKRRSAIGWRKTILLNRNALLTAWDCHFPYHDILTLGLRKRAFWYSSSEEFWKDWNAVCDQAEKEVKRNKNARRKRSY